MVNPIQRPRSLQNAKDPGAPERWNPQPLASLEDTGLTKLALADHVLKILYFGGDLTGSEVSERIRLPFASVLDPVFEFLKREKFIEVRGGTSGGFNESQYRYIISIKGVEKAQ